jgi:hypothetical protein
MRTPNAHRGTYFFKQHCLFSEGVFWQGLTAAYLVPFHVYDD